MSGQSSSPEGFSEAGGGGSAAATAPEDRPVFDAHKSGRAALIREMARYLGMHIPVTAGEKEMPAGVPGTPGPEAAGKAASAQTQASSQAAAMTALLEDALDRVTAASDFRSVSGRFELAFPEDGTLSLAGTPVRSASLKRNLSGCTEVLFYAATLGAEADRILRRAELSDMALASCLQAAAAAWIEACIEDDMDGLRAGFREEGLALRPRYSPGYGDLPLEFQRDFFRILRPQRRIGVTLTDACLMVPSKSVTALVGIYPAEPRAEDPQP